MAIKTLFHCLALAAYLLTLSYCQITPTLLKTPSSQPNENNTKPLPSPQPNSTQTNNTFLVSEPIVDPFYFRIYHVMNIANTSLTPGYVKISGYSRAKAYRWKGVQISSLIAEVKDRISRQQETIYTAGVDEGIRDDRFFFMDRDLKVQLRFRQDVGISLRPISWRDLYSVFNALEFWAAEWAIELTDVPSASIELFSGQAMEVRVGVGILMETPMGSGAGTGTRTGAGAGAGTVAGLMAKKPDVGVESS
ncbi:MAG: hypothetical protein Q9164_004717 [Protoblastenia rupestris]